MEIDIPFLDQFKEPMLKGIKTVTSRNKIYGDTGDRFKKWGMVFELRWIEKIPLVVVACHWYKEEGFNSTDEFIEIWKNLHPRKGFDPDHLVYMHKFHRLVIIVDGGDNRFRCPFCNMTMIVTDKDKIFCPNCGYLIDRP